MSAAAAWRSASAASAVSSSWLACCSASESSLQTANPVEGQRKAWKVSEVGMEGGDRRYEGDCARAPLVDELADLLARFRRAPLQIGDVLPLGALGGGGGLALGLQREHLRTWSDAIALGRVVKAGGRDARDMSAMRASIDHKRDDITLVVDLNAIGECSAEAEYAEYV